MFRTAAAASALGAAALTIAALTTGTASAEPSQKITPGTVVQSGNAATFTMVRSTAAEKAGCLGTATAKVRVTKLGDVEELKIAATGLPKQTGFDLFVLQTPDLPFGVSWYQSDLRSDKNGNAFVAVRGRFNEETFSISPGPAPVVQTHPGLDATGSSPTFKPIHQYHLGFWFNSPADAVKAGCPGTVTPFNGEHDAGTQAMSTRNFPAGQGPLGEIEG